MTEERPRVLGAAIRLSDGRVAGGEGFVGHGEVRDSLEGPERRAAGPATLARGGAGR